jgi:imidazolonepropionase-like amidohydrolase
MRVLLALTVLCVFVVQPGSAQAPQLSRGIKDFVTVNAPVIALTHVRVVDGSGAPARASQTIIIAHGKIQSIGDASSASVPDSAKVLDMSGNTALPGLVMLHEHMYYTTGVAQNPDGSIAEPIQLNQLGYSAPRLYLACGVTSMRTAGSVEPYEDLNIKRKIDAGEMPGPKMHVTGPYLEGAHSFFAQMHELTGPDDARKTVDYWADEGVTSFKAYMNITRAELKSAIDEAHKRGIKVTGHLCSIGYREAAALGIDDLEHGPMFVDTEFVPGKQPDVCPRNADMERSLLQEDVAGANVQGMLHDLVARHVAVTSTLPVFELDVPGRPRLRREVLQSMTPEAEASYLKWRAERQSADVATSLKKEMQFEHEFAKAGGLLLAGSDPTGIGGVLPGFGDQREVELLVEAGFTPVEAIHVASANGAEFLGESAQVGTLAPGKAADLLVVRGDPSTRIEDIENVNTVFKDGVGYDSARLVDSVRGLVGLR